MQHYLALLVDASETLVESLQLGDMLPRIMRVATRAIDADAYAIWTVDDRQRAWCIQASEGLSETYLRGQTTIPIVDDMPDMSRPHVVPDISTDTLLRGGLSSYEDEGIRSLLALPLRISGAVTGYVTFYFRTPRNFTDAEVHVATALANLSSSAIGAARLREDERLARARVEDANKKLAFLSHVSDALIESLEYKITLRKVARLAVPLLADWCIVNVVEEPGIPPTLAVAHRDPEKMRLAAELVRRYPAEPDPDAEHGWARVLRTREPDLLPDIAESMVQRAAQDAEHLRMLRELGLRSSLVLPLIARGNVLGALTLITADLHPPLTEADIPLAQELARRAALAIDNAQLYRHAQGVADDLKKANAVKDEFLGLVSHELRTPVTVILGDSHVLMRGGDHLDEEARAEALQDINTEAERLNRIIENLLVLARVDQSAGVEAEPVLLNQRVAHLVDVHRSRAPWREIALEMDDEPLLARGSDFCVEQTVRNFLSNAEKYSAPESRIDVQLRREGQEATIRVLDRGRGVSPEEVESLFEPFYRSPSTSFVSGVGIGLTVCKRLVEEHSGRIWARPRDGGGAEFGFSLPLADDAGVPGT